MARRKAQSPHQDDSRRSHQRRNDFEPSNTAEDTESQQVLALSRMFQQPTGDEDIQQFRTKVSSDQKKLTALLEQRMRKAKGEETRRREEVLSAIVEALQTANRPAEGSTPNFAGTKIAGNAVYASVVDVMASSKGLIKEYKRLDGTITQMRTEQPIATAEKWKQDIQETDEQLNMGARVALRNVKKVLGADVQGDDLETAEQDSEVRVEGSVEPEKRELNYDLLKSLRYAERGVKRMVKGLPSDEAD